MAHSLRDRGSPRAFAESRQVIDFKGDLAEFRRLAGIVEKDLAILSAADRPACWRRTPVTLSLEFGFADQRETLPAVTGTVSVTLDAVCQRCLEPLRLPLEVALKLVLLEAGRDAQGFDDHEVWELAEDELTPLDLAEEALIMALPLSAAHPRAALCGPLAARVGNEGQGRGDRVRPFAGLKDRLDELK